MHLFFLTSMITLFYYSQIVGFERCEPHSPNLEELYIQLPVYHTPSNSPEPQSDFPSIPEPELPSEPFQTFWDWKNACMEAIKRGKSPVTKEQFIQEMRNFCLHFKSEKNSILYSKNWVKPSHSDNSNAQYAFFTWIRIRTICNEIGS